MPIKVMIEKDGKQYYADGDKVFAWLQERYIKNSEKRSQAKTLPYKERLDNFFESLKTTELAWYNELKSAYPSIDVDFASKRAKLWLSSNYKKDFKKFLMNWMSKENPTIQVEQKQQEESKDNPAYLKRLELQKAFKQMQKNYERDE